jgi:hypothetical protein
LLQGRASQKCLAAKSPSRTTPETAVTTTMLIRLCVAIDTVEAAEAGAGLVFDFLRLAFCGVFFAGIAFP